MGAATAVIAAAFWIAVGAFPLVAAPQIVNDAAGVSVDTGNLAQTTQVVTVNFVKPDVAPPAPTQPKPQPAARATDPTKQAHVAVNGIPDSPQSFEQEPAARANIFSAGNGVLPPKLLLKVDPQYSEQARAAKYSGSVTLSIVVGTDGRATNIQVLKPLGMGLDEQAVAAVREWIFQPGTSLGEPVNVRATVEVNFREL